jgi:hypothetical protein
LQILNPVLRFSRSSPLAAVAAINVRIEGTAGKAYDASAFVGFGVHAKALPRRCQERQIHRSGV